jgi:hypothetical protein
MMQRPDPDKPLTIGGRNVWYGLDLQPISTREANELLGSEGRKRVALTNFGNGYSVSTVFLVLDHNHGDGPPVLWETMVFDPEGEALGCRRYTSRDDAQHGHDETVAEIRAMFREVEAITQGAESL